MRFAVSNLAIYFFYNILEKLLIISASISLNSANTANAVCFANMIESTSRYREFGVM
jgi:hypothetical protein